MERFSFLSGSAGWDPLDVPLDGGVTKKCTKVRIYQQYEIPRDAFHRSIEFGEEAFDTMCSRVRRAYHATKGRGGAVAELLAEVEDVPVRVVTASHLKKPEAEATEHRTAGDNTQAACDRMRDEPAGEEPALCVWTKGNRRR